MNLPYMSKLAGVVIGLLALSGAMPAVAETFYVDPVHSSVVFRIQHLGVSDSFGRFNDPTGRFKIDEDNPEKNSIEISVKSKKVDTANAKRDKNLRSPDFFDVEAHPAITFKSRTFEKTGMNTYRVSGDLTMLGVTRPLTVTATRVGTGKDPWGGYRTGFTTEFSIKRTEFGMDYLLSGLGDEVHVIVSIEGIRKKKVQGFKSD